MSIKLTGGNGYQYAFKPSYAQANGRGYITGNELLGQDSTMTPKMAYEFVKEYKKRGETPPADLQALADQYREDLVTKVADTAGNIISDVSDAIGSIFGAKKDSARSQAEQDKLMSDQSRDNTALIVTGAVAGVALLAVTMSKKPRRR